MRDTAEAIVVMKDVVKDLVQHYGKNNTKLMMTQLHAKLGALVFHRSFATPVTAKKTLQTNPLGSNLDLMTHIAQRWMLSLSFSIANEEFRKETAVAMTVYLDPEEPVVSVTALSTSLQEYPIVLAMYYFYNAYPLGEFN